MLSKLVSQGLGQTYQSWLPPIDAGFVIVMFGEVCGQENVRPSASSVSTSLP